MKVKAKTHQKIYSYIGATLKCKNYQNEYVIKKDKRVYITLFYNSILKEPYWKKTKREPLTS